MERTNAIREMPRYAETELPKSTVMHRVKMTNKNAFLRKYGIVLILMAGFTIYTVLLSAYVNYKAEKRVRAEVIAEFEQKAENDKKAKENAEKASQFLSGEKSKKAAIDALTPWIARHISCLRMERGVTVEGAKTYVWGVDLPRLASGKYGDIESVLNGNIEGYIPDYPVRNEDLKLAEDISTDYINGVRPDDWTPDLEFAVINADGSVTARNQYVTTSMTKFWRWRE